MRQTLAFTSPHAGGVTGLRVFFVVSRTSIFGTAVSGLPAATRVSTLVGENGVDAHWAPELGPGSEVYISMEVEGEPLVVSRTLWFRGELPVMEDPVVPGSLGANSADALTDPDAYAIAKFRERCEAVSRDPRPLVRKYGEFFCELDLHTNLKLVMHAGLSDAELQARIAVVQAAEPEVYRRILRRRKHAPNGKCGQPKQISAIPHVCEISGLMLGIYRKHLSTNRVLDAHEVWTAFEMFANGELRVPGTDNEVWNGEPNSAMAFGFAEFAFEAIDQGIDADEWRLILPSHVAMQRIYCMAYHPPTGKDLTFDAYLPANRALNEPVNDDFKKKLRTEFSPMEPEPLKLEAATILCEALRHQP